MNTALLIYLVMMLDTISAFFTIAAVLSAVATVLCVIIFSTYYSDQFNDAYIDGFRKQCEKNSQLAQKIGSRAFYSSIVFIFLAVITPTTKTAIYMIGGSGVVKVLQSEQAQEVGGKAYRLLMKKLDEELAE